MAKRKLTDMQKKQMVALHDDGVSVGELCASFGVSRSSFYVWRQMAKEIPERGECQALKEEVLRLRRSLVAIEMELDLLKVHVAGLG